MLAVVVCLSVCPSQAGVVSKRLDESSWFLAWRLPSTSPTLGFRNLGTSKIKDTSCGALSQSMDLENFFAIISQWRCQQNSSTVELGDCSYDNQRVVEGLTITEFITGRSTETLQPHCFDLFSICYHRESFREGLWNHRRTFVCLFVCLFDTTITK